MLTAIASSIIGILLFLFGLHNWRLIKKGGLLANWVEAFIVCCVGVVIFGRGMIALLDGSHPSKTASPQVVQRLSDEATEALVNNARRWNASSSPTPTSLR